MGNVVFEPIEKAISSVILKRDDSGAQLILSNHQAVSITLPESSVLQQLIVHQGVASKKELITHAWGSPEIIGPNSLPVAITNLRKVLKLEGIQIVNVPRQGYKLVLHEEPASAQANTSTETKTQPTQTEGPHSLNILNLSMLLRLCTSLSITVLSLLAIAYWWFSWVTIDCTHINESKKPVCIIRGDDRSEIPPVLPVVPNDSTVYYSSTSGLVVHSKEGD